jgi:small conductance mechanosensitive channel
MNELFSAMHGIIIDSAIFLPSFIWLVIGLAILKITTQYQSHDKKARFRKQLVGISATLVITSLVILNLPIEADTRSQLLTLFGLLLTAVITLASPSIAANVMAGIMLRSLRNFTPGDFIQCDKHFGRVIEQNLFHVEIQTPDRDFLILPNTFITSHPLKVFNKDGTVISAEVSLGYDVDHQIIEKLLIEASLATNLEDPFVHIVELNDFSVVYRCAGILVDPKLMITTRSTLRGAMLDKLHHAGIEIVSPSFMNQRPAPTKVIPRLERSEHTTLENNEANIESIIFDKAEQAEQLAYWKQELTDIEASLKDKTSELSDDQKKQMDFRRRAIQRLLQFAEKDKRSD